MDKKRSVLNVTVSILSHILLLFSSLFVRRLLIRHIGNDVNGLNSLFTSIIGMLAVAELGVGSAITFSMYKPIVDGNTGKVAALYGYYKRLYRIIGLVIFGAGLLVLPFLPRLIGDYETIDRDVYIPYLLRLLSVVLTYLYGAKISLIQAHKNNFITTGILTIGKFIGCGLQAITILLWKSFSIYLICYIIEILIIWLLTGYVANRDYKGIVTKDEAIDAITKAEIGKNTKAMFMHKIGTVLVNSIDGLIISAFVGVVILGKYSNYTLICSGITGIITLFFTPLTSVIGHLHAAGDAGETKKWFDRFYSLNYILGVVFFLGYYAVVDEAVRLCFGDGLAVSHSISFVITLNQFTKFMRKTALLFRDASGSFYYDRWKPIAEGVANLILSLIFVQVFPEEYKVVGVIVATIITTLGICHIVDPYVVYKHAFHKSVKEYYLRNYGYIILFIVALLIVERIGTETDGILINGIIAIGVSGLVLGFVMIVDKSFRRSVGAIIHTRRSFLFH